MFFLENSLGSNALHSYIRIVRTISRPSDPLNHSYLFSRRLCTSPSHSSIYPSKSLFIYSVNTSSPLHITRADHPFSQFVLSLSHTTLSLHPNLHSCLQTTSSFHQRFLVSTNSHFHILQWVSVLTETTSQIIKRAHDFCDLSFQIKFHLGCKSFPSQHHNFAFSHIHSIFTSLHTEMGTS